MEIDHIIPRSQGGKNRYDNLRLFHRHCHDTKTSRDTLPTILSGVYDKHQGIKEPDEPKGSHPFLKSSGVVTHSTDFN
ncbi:MAG: group intron reverse transcriptase/maturase [Cyanobacteriota bacterium]|jgi:RNA-directed DNA polymerase